MLSFQLNNEERLRQVNIDPAEGHHPNTTVLEYVRQIGLTGTKEGCAEGDCGACTVAVGEIVDGKLQYKACTSCLLFLPKLQGKHLVTVEGLATGGELHPVQEAMVANDGSQCGYCTPGIIMSLFVMYQEMGSAEPDYLDALTGNLCRCTGYRSIKDAAIQIVQSNDHGRQEQFAGVTDQLLSIKPTNGESHLLSEEGYWLPRTIAEAIKLYTQMDGATFVCGGTDLALRVTKKNEKITPLIDLSHIEEMLHIHESEHEVVIGAVVSLEALKGFSEGRFQALYDTLEVFGSRQIRESATLGGNLAGASPIADTIPTLSAMGASVNLQGPDGTRQMKLTDFITGYRQTKLLTGEIITSVVIPKSGGNAIVKWYKISKRKDLDISTLSGGFRLVLEDDVAKDIQLFYGGMAAMVKRAEHVEKALLHKEWTEENVAEALTQMENDFTPISDARSGKEARAILARNLVWKLWGETAPQKQKI